MSWLKVSDNGRFLIKQDGTPFFYLGDTAWELFHRLKREDVDLYLRDRAKKNFSVIQAVILAETDGLATPNAYSHTPLIDDDPAKPNENYFAHVDYCINTAATEGLYVGLVPAWASYVVGDSNPKIFNERTASVYGEFLGRRYRDMSNIIWIVGGDRNPVWEGADYRAVWRALAAGLKEGDGGRHLVTFHPRGDLHSSSIWFHEDDWLDFNMMQTGPRRDLPNYERIAQDYCLVPPKPTMDGEPGYEDAHPHINPANGRLTDYDARKYAYWALFAGAHGHTYGCLEIWQMYDPPKVEPVNGARVPWREALHFPGACHMQYVRGLIESRPFLTRIPDQSMIASDQGAGSDRVQASRDSEGSFAFIYISSGKPVAIRLGKIAGSTVSAYWYNPRRGSSTFIDQFPNRGTREFVPPSYGPGNDWVLVLDDAKKDFPAPGAGYAAVRHLSGGQPRLLQGI
jgi:hypothetical protein